MPSFSRRPQWPRRATAALVAAFLCAGLATSASATEPRADVKTCAGVNMLDELKTTAPAAYAEIKARAGATLNSGAVLWRIERKDVPASYLLGTIHMTDPRVATLSPAVEKAIAETETVALEVADVSSDATSAALAKAARLVLFTDGRTLDKFLSDEEYAKVKKTLSGAGLPGEAAAMFRPWVVSMILSVSACERRKVKDGLPVLDMQIASAARRLGMKVVGLETIEGQLSAMAAIPDDQQIAMLRASLKFAHRSNDTMETLLQLYLSRDMGAAWPFHLALAEQAGISQQSFTAFQKGIVNDRNEHMRDTSLPLIAKGRAFIAVGALHLVGEKGLVALLREKGYTLTPIE